MVSSRLDLNILVNMRITKIKYNRLRWLAIAVLPILFLASGCRNAAPEKNIDAVSVVLDSRRFDLDLFALDTNHLGAGLQQLAQKYPDFLNFYLDTLMDYGIHGNFSDDNPKINNTFRAFITYKDFTELEDTIKKYYPDSKYLDEELTKAFRHMKYYFPTYHIPKIIYLDMELRNYPAFPIDTATMCVGLDMFLGQQFPHYTQVGIPQYLGPHLSREYLPVSVLSAAYRFQHPFQQDDRTLLDLMLQRGREQYFLHKILTDKTDAVLFGFNKTQMEWCNRNEANIYHFFVNNNLLYNKEALSRFSYIKDGPFAQGMESVADTVKVSPGNVGTYLGYKIVAAYMERFPNVTLGDLLAQHSDAARFLDSARYKPR
jgi:hypothetical protein